MYIITHISVKSQMPSPFPLPLFQRSPTSLWLLKLLSFSLRLRRDLAKLVIKAKRLRGPKTKVRVRRKSPPQKLKTPPRTRKLQLRQMKQRPKLKKLILRPRTLLPLSRARKKTLLLPRPRLSTQDFLVIFLFFFNYIFFIVAFYQCM